jgi:hypothetical protein
MNKKRTVLGLGMGVVLLVIAGLVWAQPPQGGQQGGRQRGGQQGGRQRGNFDPARMQQMIADRMKEQLGASDDEWKIIGPRLTKVMTLSMQSRGGGRGMMGMFGGGRGGRPGGDRGGNQDRQLTGVAKVTDEMRVLLDGNPTPEQLKSKLTALRKARESAKAELAKAQAALKQVLSLKQECQLVMMGTLN